MEVGYKIAIKYNNDNNNVYNRTIGVVEHNEITSALVSQHDRSIGILATGETEYQFELDFPSFEAVAKMEHEYHNVVWIRRFHPIRHWRHREPEIEWYSISNHDLYLYDPETRMSEADGLHDILTRYREQGNLCYIGKLYNNQPYQFLYRKGDSRDE